MTQKDKYKESLNTAAEKYVRKHYYKNAWKTEKNTFLAGAKWTIKNPNWIRVSDKFPTPEDGHILVLWEDGLPDIGYIGAELDVIETVRDRPTSSITGDEGHSIEWWMPIPDMSTEMLKIMRRIQGM